MEDSLEEKLGIIIKEASVHRRALVYGFICISLLVLVAGLYFPKKYESSATIIVNQKDIIEPLMEGRAVATGLVDVAEQARELVYSRQFLTKVMKAVGWLDTPLTPIEEERIRDSLKKAIGVKNSGENLIDISYQDEDPERAKLTVDKLVEFFIEDSRIRKSEESRKAYEFVDSQVEAYHKKLVEAENRLKDFRSKNAGFQNGSDTDTNRRIAALRGQIEQTKLSISEEEIRKGSLEKQLSGEAGLTSSLTREGQYLSRIVELQNELDTLLLSYTDTHPDVIVLKHQIEDMKRAIKKERERNRAPSGGARSENEVYVDEGVRLSPLYETLRNQLSQSKTQIATLNARLRENEKLLQEEIELNKKLHESEATLAELNRDYEVNQQIYNDLLRRRENARVSMNMDISQKGLDMKVYEPAYLPIEPSGLRLLHFAIGGIILGIALPLGALVAFLELDPRIRNKRIFEKEFGLPVITSIPRWVGEEELAETRVENRKLILMLIVSVLLYVAIGLARIKGVI